MCPELYEVPAYMHDRDRRGLLRRARVGVSRAVRALLGLSAGPGPWVALAIAFVAVTVLGTIGFTGHQEAIGALEPLGSRVYASLQLFVLEGGAVAGIVPWELQVARFAAPMVAAYALIQALAALFREQIDALRLRHASGHVVVAGLGRTGARLARELVAAGHGVVAVELDPANPDLGWLRASGGFAVIGDARRPDVLRRARVAHARHLVVLCGDDVTNAEIYASARELSNERRSGSLQCVVHLASSDLCLLLRGEELERYGSAPIRVDFVNVHAAGAQALVRAHPPTAPDGGMPRIAIVGDGASARHLLLALVRERAWSADAPDAPCLSATIVGADAPIDDLLRRHPEVRRFVDLHRTADLSDLAVRPAPDIVYVASDDDATAAADALQLRGLLRGHATRIVIALGQRSGLGRLLEGAPRPLGGPSLTTFGLLDEACQPEVLLTGTTELLARAMHRVYLASRPEAPADADPSLRPWDGLPEALRESNRDQAAHVAVKLAAIGQVIGPLEHWDGARRSFADADVETMARLEHDRWVQERRRAGWRPGERDSARRTTPYLAPWEQLPDSIRELDRVFVRQLPDLLASVGLEARSIDPDHPPSIPATAEEATPAPMAPRGQP
jgi:hypothetical protein